MHVSLLNCRLCINGELVEKRLIVSQDDGLILQETGFIGGEAIDLEGAIIAPGFLELHTNGTNGFHFTGYRDGKEVDAEQYKREIDETARFYVSRGVTGFWGTLPTVEKGVYEKTLPLLAPREIPRSAALLGAHTEGPYLAESKKGAHNALLFHKHHETALSSAHGPAVSSIKWTTLAPEYLKDSPEMIKEYLANGIKVSMGHSAATFSEGLRGLEEGATGLTHTLNAMAPLHHRDPGLAGLVTLPDLATTPSNAGPKVTPPYYAIIADGQHLHPSVATLLFRAAPHRAIIVSDSIELAGLPDGSYPGHAQIPHRQVKTKGKVVIEGTNTLIGSCTGVDECMRNVMRWSGCGVAGAVRSVTENVAGFMGLEDRGVLREGARADFVVLSDEGEVLQTWVGGYKVWSKEEGYIAEE